ncbi:unnamed protein product [Caenorhabditis auriculariae]|uniref:RNA-binding protein NOB1 n=1 Tax=Caenorhabditis auriculariae TaxID=2777116 RepID=A0A8S1GMS5_9PELO|nr:unnamed protein product [Caenorhabditis auriculariae]
MLSENEKPVKHLVLDTGALIANVNLHHLSEKYYAPPQVKDELHSAKARKVFELLPFEVILREPSSSSLRKVVDASKITGDYQSLSVVDIKVIALTYELNEEFCKEKSVEEENESNEDILAQIEKEKESAKAEVGETVSEHEEEESSSGQKTEEDSDDDSGWITQDNIDNALKKLGGFEVEEKLTVGCLTTDFALQNVLLSMHLGLISLSGYRIRKIRTFVLRCRACYSTTPVMTKVFCPSCGHKMLHKCAVSLDENGEQILHINWERLSNKRGLQYSLAAPKGGKHAINEQLFEDQPMPHMQMAKSRNDPLADGPFSMHDVNSRSAVLGIRTLNNRQRTSKNRNESKRGGRRK